MFTSDSFRHHMQVVQTLLLIVGMKRYFADELDVIALKLSLLISIVRGKGTTHLEWIQDASSLVLC